jgi:hypothetical protein
MELLDFKAIGTTFEMPSFFVNKFNGTSPFFFPTFKPDPRSKKGWFSFSIPYKCTTNKHDFGPKHTLVETPLFQPQ